MWTLTRYICLFVAFIKTYIFGTTVEEHVYLFEWGGGIIPEETWGHIG